MTISVRRADWQRDGTALTQVREIVFIIGMNVPRDIELDGQDATAHHFVACDESGRAVGTARLLPSGQIGRMAVLEARRGEGIGRRLLDAAVDTARELGFERVFLHAQVHALPFYEKAGFRVISDEFVEAGIPHREMEFALAMPFDPDPADRGRRIDNPSSRAVREIERQNFQTASEATDALRRVLTQARRQVQLLSAELDATLFDDTGVIEAISAHARRAAQTEVRILIVSSASLLQRSHGFIGLAQRLPSKIVVRRIDEDHPIIDTGQCFAVVDRRAIWVQPDAGVYTGWASTNDAVEAERFASAFDAAFEQAREDPELRLLRI